MTEMTAPEVQIQKIIAPWEKRFKLIEDRADTAKDLLDFAHRKMDQLSKDFIESHDGIEGNLMEIREELRSLTPPAPDRAELYAALAAAQGEIQAAEANKEAEIRKKDDYSVVLYTFRYADLAACLEVIREPLSKNGLALIQIPSLGESGAVHMRTILAHSSGETISCEMSMVAEKSGPQAIGTCMAYLRRYSLCAMVGVAQFDDDAASATKDADDYERITAEEIDAILALADKLFDDKADFVIQQMVEKTFDVTHVSHIKAGEADLAMTRLKNTDRREKARAKKAAEKPSPKPPTTESKAEPGADG